MNRFLVAVALTAVFGLGTSTKAQAQISYGYTVPVYGGVESTATTYSPFGSTTTTAYYSPFTGLQTQTTGSYQSVYGSKTYMSYYSPFTGLVGQSYTTNPFGAANTLTYGYNPYTGDRYGTGIYQPNTYVYPNVGYNYGFLRRRYY
jgi:hypothetical protein